ncbi:MAG: amino acid permease [Rickettsiaceae bacterium]|nr:amino acid permease [Rickettsiaceae bacterium]
MNFLRRKTLEQVREVSQRSTLAKTLTAFDLILFGLGAIIGTGVFVFTGSVAAKYSGPAVMLSYAISGVTCIFVALAYTELASMLPTSGSVYTYAYVGFGEIVAWIMGGVLILELCFGAAVVAAGWSAYIQGIAESAGYTLPPYLAKVYAHGGFVNAPAIFITSIVGFVLYRGTKESKKINAVLVLVKIGAIAAFTLAALPHFNINNWENFMPYGFDDVVIGASILFFSFSGFGALASSAEECKNPEKDLITGIVGSLVASTLIYVAIGGLVTGIAPYYTLDNAQALATALKLNGSHIGSVIVATGAVCGMTTVIMMSIYAQSRIFYVIARDGLLPKFFAKIHPKNNNPHITIVFFSCFAAIISGFVPYETIGKLTSMGALIDYMVVCITVMLFRFKFPDARRPFKCPTLFIIAPLAFLACSYLLFKQVIDKNMSLSFTGQLLIGWIILLIILYVARRQFVISSKQATISLQ